jgi:outer membrane receptor protein involved in Fe transport
MNIDALLTARYIDKIVVKNPSVCPTTETCNPAPGDPVPTVTHPWPNLKIPSVTYLDFNVGYTFPTQTKIQAGVQNLTDKQPPIFYQNNVTNANTNVETYDTLGRKWWVSFNQKF